MLNDNRMWNIVKLMHEQVIDALYALLEANTVADVWEMEDIYQLCENMASCTPSPDCLTAQLPDMNTCSHPQRRAHRLPAGERERSNVARQRSRQDLLTSLTELVAHQLRMAPADSNGP